MACDCLSVYLVPQVGEPINFELIPVGTYNGEPYFSFSFDGGTIYLYYAGECFWVLSASLGGVAIGGLNNCDCPIGTFDLTTPKIEEFTISECTPPIEACPCIKIGIISEEISYTYNVTQTLTFNDYPAYQFNINPISTLQISLWWFSGTWFFGYGDIGNFLAIIGLFESDSECPQGIYTIVENDFGITHLEIGAVDCDECIKREDRQKFEYKAIKFPQIFIEQNRGLKDCCCKFNVLAGGSSESWKNDVTSAWLKLSDPTDTLTFQLTKDGQPTIYTCTQNLFPNEENAFYTTIQWSQVLTSDGIGCYKLEVTFNISGVSGSFVWGIYNLQQYTIQKALKTARVRAIFNGYHEIEGIDFTGANVESTHRFFGFIGNRQPNTEIDNIIYSTREMKRVIRENLNDYEIITDPEDECIIKPLVDLYLLSENELYISDYNAHNHSYRYLDIPVIVKESPTIEYKELSRKAVLTCKVEDKFKTNRTYYNG